jgi:glycosyltransferase involved in cell wall biosynthesis
MENRAVERLRNAGVPYYFRLESRPLPQRIMRRLQAFYSDEAKLELTMREAILFQPQLVVINQGNNNDGLHWARLCRQYGWPYVYVSQQASDNDWPDDSQFELNREAHQGAAHTCFVSHDNLRATQEQIGADLPNAQVIRNPYVVRTDHQSPWPVTDTVNLALPGRLCVNNKGHDMLFRVLRAEKWRNRPLRLNLYGKGPNAVALESLRDYFGLQNVIFHGQISDMNKVWAENHALVLASRKEGLPLVLVEAMMMGRMGIVTPCAGCPEVITDGVSGFVAESISEAGLDAVLDRAWAERDCWENIGMAARKEIKQHVPKDPVESFKHLLEETLQPSHAKAVGHAAATA